MKNRMVIALGLLTIVLSGRAQAGYVIALADSNINNAANNQLFSNLFSGDDVFGRTASTDWTLTNWSSYIAANAASYVGGPLSAGALIGKEWLVASTNVGYSAGELALVQSFVAGGGNLIVMGEGPIYTTENANANAVLAAIGSSMSFLGLEATGSVIITPHALTAGVTGFSRAYTGTVSGGNALITLSNGRVAMAYETVAAAVPEPGAIAMWSLTALGFVCVRRCRRTVKG